MQPTTYEPGLAEILRKGMPPEAVYGGMVPVVYEAPEAAPGGLGALVASGEITPTRADIEALRDQSLKPVQPFLGETIEGLPAHFGALPVEDRGLEPARLGAATPRNLSDLYKDAASESVYDAVKLAEDPRGPLGAYRDHVFFGGPDSGVAEDLALWAPRLGGMIYSGVTEGVEEGDPWKVAGGVGLSALLAAPALSRSARNFMHPVADGKQAMGAARTAKDIGKVGLTGGGFGASLSALDGSLTKAFAADDRPDYLLQVEAMQDIGAKLSSERAKLLEAKINPELKLSDPVAIKELQKRIGVDVDGHWAKGTNDSIKAYNDKLNRQIADIEERLKSYSPEAIADFARREKKIYEDDADKREAAFYAQPSRDAYPWLAPIAAGLGATATGTLAYTLGRRAANRYNKEAANTSQKWSDDVKSAYDPTDVVKADLSARSAVNYPAQMDQLDKILHPGWQREAMALAGYGGLTDIGFAAPEIADLVRGVSDEDFNGWDLAKRYATGILGGIAIGKLGDKAGHEGWVNTPERFDAQSMALKDILDGHGNMPAYYREMADKTGFKGETGLDTYYLDARQTRDNDAQRRETDRLNNEARQRGARLAAEGSLFQREGLRGVLGGLVNGRSSRGASDPQPQTQRQQSDDLSSRKASGERVEQIEYQTSTKGQPQQLTARPRHSDKKRAAVEKGLDSGKSVKELAKKHKVPERTIYEWRREMSRARRMSELESKAGKPE